MKPSPTPLARRLARRARHLILPGLIAALPGLAAAGAPAPSTPWTVAQAGAAPVLPRLPRVDPAEEALPSVELTPQLVFQILAAEVALQRGQLGTAATTYLELARSTQDPRLARRAVELALAERGLERAAAAAQVWVQTAPASRIAAQTLETLQLSLGRYDAAEPLVQRRLADARRDGALPDTYASLARVLARTPDKAAARALLQRASQPDLNVADAWLARSTLAAATEAFDEATTTARQAVKLAPASETAVVSLARLLQRTEQGNAEALALLEGFVARQPASQEARFQLARVHAADGRWSVARGHFEQVLQQDPNNPSTLLALAQVAWQAGQPRDAEGYLRRYVDLPRTIRRDNAPAFLFLAQLAEEDQRLPEAVQWLGRVDAGDQYLPALTRRAQLLARLDRVEEARQILRESRGAGTSRVPLVVAEAQILRDAQRTPEAFTLLDEALAREPEQPELLYEHALTAERLGRHALMETNLRRLIALRPRNAHAYNALGYSFAERNVRLDEALALIQTAVELAPEDPYILDSLGWVHFRLGNTQEALTHLQRAYGMRPDAEIAAHLGEVLWTLGRTDEARRLWAEARGREPGNTTLRGTLARLNVSL